jgi:hypothetical protein
MRNFPLIGLDVATLKSCRARDRDVIESVVDVKTGPRIELLPRVLAGGTDRADPLDLVQRGAEA